MVEAIGTRALRRMDYEAIHWRMVLTSFGEITCYGKHPGSSHRNEFENSLPSGIAETQRGFFRWNRWNIVEC